MPSANSRRSYPFQENLRRLSGCLACSSAIRSARCALDRTGTHRDFRRSAAKISTRRPLPTVAASYATGSPTEVVDSPDVIAAARKSLGLPWRIDATVTLFDDATQRQQSPSDRLGSSRFATSSLKGGKAPQPVIESLAKSAIERAGNLG
jgi:hypothetical protein